jgi:hypothetical protein
MSAGIELDREFVAEFCRRHYVRRHSLFGSVLTDRFRPESDVDVLVQLEADHTPGFLALERMQFGIMGRPVDLRTPKDLSRFFRGEVFRSAEAQYSAG